MYAFWAFLSFIIMSSARGTTRVKGQPPAKAVYSQEPDLVFVVMMGVLDWLWVMAVYGYYVAVAKGKMRAFNYGHLAEVLVETLLWFFTILAVALGFARAPGYKLFPSFMKATLGACVMLFFAWLSMLVSVVLLWFSGRLTLKGPSIANYNLEDAPEESPRIPMIATGLPDEHNTRDMEQGADKDFEPT